MGFAKMRGRWVYVEVLQLVVLDADRVCVEKEVTLQPGHRDRGQLEREYRVGSRRESHVVFCFTWKPEGYMIWVFLGSSASRKTDTL